MKNIARGFTVVFVPGIILLVLIFALATNDDFLGLATGIDDGGRAGGDGTGDVDRRRRTGLERAR